MQIFTASLPMFMQVEIHHDLTGEEARALVLLEGQYSLIFLPSFFLINLSQTILKIQKLEFNFRALWAVPLYTECIFGKSRSTAQQFWAIWESNISASSVISLLQAKIRTFLLSFVPVIVRTKSVHELVTVKQPTNEKANFKQPT